MTSEKRKKAQRKRRSPKAAKQSTSARGRRASVDRPPRLPRLDPGHEQTLANMLGEVADLAVAAAAEFKDGLEAEMWASAIASMWRFGCFPDPDGDADRLYGKALVRALEHHGGPDALAALRALAAVGGDCYVEQACVAAERLSSAGAPEPRWIEDLGVRPVTARMMCDDGFDDGRSVLIEFATRDGKPHTLGVYIDHNMRGLVKDVFVAGPLAGVTKALASGDGIVLSELDLAEARARVERALDVLDHTISPAVDKDVDRLRAFMYARARLLPGGTVLPDEFDEVDEVEPSEREGLLADFLSAAEGERWRGDDDASHIVAMAIDFGADYNYGGPLRWSPVVVETFMTGWLAHKVRAEVDFFERVPEVLRDWVRYAGRRRGVEPAGVAQAVMIVGLYRQPMLDAVADPERWGAAKAFLIAAERAGVDLADADALNEFADRYNESLAA